MLSSSSERNTRPGAGDSMNVPYWSRVTSPSLVVSWVIVQWLESIAVNRVSSMLRPSKVTSGDGSVSQCKKADRLSISSTVSGKRREGVKANFPSPWGTTVAIVTCHLPHFRHLTVLPVRRSPRSITSLERKRKILRYRAELVGDVPKSRRIGCSPIDAPDRHLA
jgi:hypothetical protein